MVEGEEPMAQPAATYEIRLRSTPPEPLRERFPSATILTTRTETVLFRRVDEVSELDKLLDELLSMGAVLTEVHELPLSPVEEGATSTDQEGGSSR
jgi:hypothetical protein